jgi:DNA-binding response OmpR family regulator
MNKFDVLKGKKVLLIEDDKDTSDLLKSELEYYRMEVLPQIHSVEKAIEVLNSEPQQKDPSDFLILDMMLPQTEADHQKISELQEKLKELRKIFEGAGFQDTRNYSSDEITKARKTRKETLEEIKKYINEKGAIEVYKSISKEMKAKYHIIILSALGSSELKKELDLDEFTGAWLVKPQSAEAILDAARRLLLTDSQIRD